MMTNLFSAFDPSTRPFLSLGWLAIFFFMSFIPASATLLAPRTARALGLPLSYLRKELAPSLAPSHAPVVSILLSYFVLIAIGNSLGLFPYNFTPTSHLSITLVLALPLWLAYTGVSILLQTSSMFSHLVPTGTPLALAPLMVVIETVSNLIRPLTLAVRLAANMIAGHLLIGLLNSYASLASFTISVSIVSTGLLLMLLESAVALIQGYVFMTLSSLYLNEV